MDKFKEDSLKILFSEFPPDKYDPVSIHTCADEWVTKQEYEDYLEMMIDDYNNSDKYR